MKLLFKENVFRQWTWEKIMNMKNKPQGSIKKYTKEVGRTLVKRSHLLST